MLSTAVVMVFGSISYEINPIMLQAFDRVGGKAGNKGAEAALTAVSCLCCVAFDHIVINKLSILSNFC